MARSFFLSLILLCFVAASSQGAIYKGQKEFVKKCLQCHDSGQTFVASYKMKYWKKMMAKKGKKLVKLHLKSEKAKNAWEYFESKKFQRKARHLKQFLVEYAKDSGNVPACN